MPKTPPPDIEPPQQRRFWLILFSRPVVGTLLVLLTLVAAGCWRLLAFIDDELAPLISENLSDSLNRPVKVGELEQYSLTGMRFGPSELPAYETQVEGKTVLDKDVATVEAVDVSFDIWKTLQTRTLNLDVTLVNSKLYIDEDETGRWILTSLDEEDEDEPDPFVKIQLDELRVKNGQAIIDPIGAQTRTIEDFNGAIAISEERIGVQGQADIDSGGTTRVDAEWLQASESLKLNLKTKDLAAVPLLGLVPAKLPLKIRSGTVDGNFDIEYQPQQPIKLTGKAEITDADVQLPEQDIRVKARRLNSNFRVAYKENQLPTVGGQAEFQGGNLSIPEKLIFQNGRSQQQQLRNTSGKLKFIEDKSQVQFEARGKLASGGRLRTQGATSLDLQKINILLLARNISAPILDRAFDLPLQVNSGRIDANLNIKLRPDQLPNVRGTARIQKVNAQITGIPQPFSNTNGFVRFRGGLTTSLEGVTARYGQVPLTASGVVDIERGYNITAQTTAVEVDTALNTLGIGPETLPFPIVGKVRVPSLRVTGNIENPVISGQVAASKGTQIDRVPFNRLNAQFQLAAPEIRISKIDARPQAGGRVTGQARYNLTPGSNLVANLDARNMPGDKIARLYGPLPGLTLGPISAQVNLSGPPDDIQTKVDFQATRATYPTTGRLRLRRGIVAFENIVAWVADGTARINGQLKDQRLQANVKVAGIALKNFSKDLRGALDGSVNVSGPLASLSAETIRADGNLRLSKGLSIIENPLTTQFRWDGRQIVVKDASAKGFRANGTIAAQIQGGPKITGLDLNLLARDFDLRSLSALGPTPVPVRGFANLTGRLRGTLEAPRLNASLAVNKLAVSQFAFEPTLRGQINYGQGLDLNLQGSRDRIQVALAPNLQPKSFFVKRDEVIAKGTGQGDLLQVKLQQFPLTAFNLQPEGIGRVSGVASGDFQANLKTQSLKGAVAVNKPGIGNLKGDQITGNIQYENGVATLKNGRLLKRDSQYLLNATLEPGDTPRYEGQLKIVRGQIKDVVAVTQSLQSLLGDSPPGESVGYGTAADVRTTAVGVSEAPLLVQLQRLAEVEQILAQEEAEKNSTSSAIDIANLTGQFDGQISIAGAGFEEIDGAFDLRGQNFILGNYRIEQVVAAGGVQDGTLRLAPIKLATGDRQAIFTGKIGLEEQTGELLVQNVAVDPVNQFVNLPVKVAGNLNGKAILSGSLFDPQMKGQFSLADAKLGDTPVTRAETDLSYQEARLRFESIAVLDNPEPILISGNIPYALGFAIPDSDEIEITAKVKNEGLALMGLVTDQVAWGGGQGEVDLQVRGTLEQPLLNGTVALQEATLKAPVLEDSLTNVTGKLQFNRNLVTIPSLKGTYNQGEMVVAGSLPIFDPAMNPPQPLTVGIDGLDVSVAGFYKGGVTGQVFIAGAAIKPTIGGSVQLDNGQVLLAKATGGSSATEIEEALPDEETAVADTNARRYIPISELTTTDQPLRLNNLALQLGDNVRVTQAPILSFVSSGNLLINGPTNAPIVDGRIRFRKGTINLITSRFRVDPRQDSFADFNPKYGLDPYLKIAMRTTVTEVTQARATALNEAEEVPASSLGSFQSVRVRATVDGRASELINNFRDVVEVTSAPRRSEGEILALLGGGVSDAVQQGQAQQAAVNLASSAAFSEIQSLFDGLLGSRASFRAFPVLLPNANEGQASVLSLGAELGYDVTDRFSVSVVQVLTGVNEPTRVNLSYDINRNLRTRTSISTNGEAVGVLEYRIRF